MKRVSSVLAFGLTVALAACLVQAKPKGATPAKPADAPKKDPATVGLVLKVVENNITVQTYGRNAGEVVVPTDAKTVIQFNGKAILVADIKPGMEIVATPNTGTAQKILVDDPAKAKPKKQKKEKKPAA